MNNDLKNFYDKQFRSKNTTLSEDSKQKVKANIFANLGVQEAKPEHLNRKDKKSYLEILRSYVAMPYVVVPLLLLLIISSSTVASAQAQPGEPLYGIKRQVEKIRLLATVDEEKKTMLQIDFAERRLAEVRLMEEKQLQQSPPQDSSTETVKPQEIDLEAILNTVEKPETVEQKAVKKMTAEARQKKYEERIKAKARADAKKALEALNKIKASYLAKGQSEKAKQVDERLRKYIKQREEATTDKATTTETGKVKLPID